MKTFFHFHQNFHQFSNVSSFYFHFFYINFNFIFTNILQVEKDNYLLVVVVVLVGRTRTHTVEKMRHNKNDEIQPGEWKKNVGEFSILIIN